MKFKDFIKARLQNIANSFPQVQIRYAFDAIADIHIVELTPQDEYYNNRKLDAEWMNISKEVLSNYSNELISFISDDCSVTIKNAEFIFNAISYKSDSINWFDSNISNSVLPRLIGYSCSFPNKFVVAKSKSKYERNNFNLGNNKFNVLNKEAAKKANEYSYAMAA